MSERSASKSLCKAQLRLTITATVGKSLVPRLKRHVVAAHALLGKKTALEELSLALVGDRIMSELHEQFMSIPGPTDVLTFPLEMDGCGRVTSGEVVIDVAEARRRAKEQDVEVWEEVLLYAIHGLLHLCGYDDRTNQDFALMHQTEDQILKKLGLEPVFHRAGNRTPGNGRGGGRR
ncbi:MAG TPA: rRNA maturation RNase YbeY [Tepidisphaeraceae bacterium]